MLVSWKWLHDYVAPNLSAEEITARLTMAGLNLEETFAVGDDLAIDLEVTSNRPDCLGHLGIAREIAVLTGAPLRLPNPHLRVSGPAASELAHVALEAPELCPRYTARIIRGVKIGPSPAWLAERLQTIGIAVINNVVDITNYVLMECGQPLHAFDFDKLRGGRIIVREARPGEPFEAIDHRTYALEAGMCVIADAERPVALAGVMGGADSEVSYTTKNILLESAQFAPRSVRATARRLNLHSPSSYRFERGVDPEGVEWASRRACELMLEFAGGELAEGVVVAESEPIAPRAPIVLRLSQLPRVLGIEVPTIEVCRILTALGDESAAVEPPSDAKHDELTFNPPSWRRDLTREIDLIEEVARIHGYDKIPEDRQVPMTASHRTDRERLMAIVRQVMTAAGFDEAMTASVVTGEWSEAISPWTEGPPLVAATPMLRGADRLRRSVLPSLLGARKVNESLGNSPIELFETARVYLPRVGQLPEEPLVLALASDGDYGRVKGVIETLLDALKIGERPEARPVKLPLFDPTRSSELHLAGRRLAVIGELSREGLKQFGLRASCTVAEVRIDALDALAVLVPQHRDQSPYPAIAQDLNFVLEEKVRWSDLAATIERAAAAANRARLEQLDYRETYRDPERDGPNRKRILLSFTLRSPERTLTGEEAEAVRNAIIAAVDKEHGGVLLA